jgi:4-oxalocrotonate tautomerase
MGAAPGATHRSVTVRAVWVSSATKAGGRHHRRANPGRAIMTGRVALCLRFGMLVLALRRVIGEIAHGCVRTAGLVPVVAGKGATRMPELTINLIEGRTVEQKRELARRMTDLVVEVLKVDASSVIIVFNENRREDKAKGGMLFLDR